MILRISYMLADHRLTRPLALLLHLAVHHHKADDDCTKCWDEMR